MEEAEGKNSLPPNVNTHFGWIRTRMGAERTLEAWVRTAVSLIAFGFTIVQFFEHLGHMQGVAPPRYPFTARYMGLTLISLGTIALIIAMWQYHALIKYLQGPKFAVISRIHEMPRSPIFVVALLLSLVGIVAFFAIMIRVI